MTQEQADNERNSQTIANKIKRVPGVIGDFDYKDTTIDFHAYCGAVSRLQGCQF